MIDCEKQCVYYGTPMCAYPKFKHHSTCLKFKSKVMDSEKKEVDVKFLNSVAIALNDVDGNVRHVQITIVQETESKQFRAYFDVVDPTKVKLADPDELRKSDSLE